MENASMKFSKNETIRLYLNILPVFKQLHSITDLNMRHHSNGIDCFFILHNNIIYPDTDPSYVITITFCSHPYEKNKTYDFKVELKKNMSTAYILMKKSFGDFDELIDLISRCNGRVFKVLYESILNDDIRKYNIMEDKK